MIPFKVLPFVDEDYHETDHDKFILDEWVQIDEKNYHIYCDWAKNMELPSRYSYGYDGQNDIRVYVTRFADLKYKLMAATVESSLEDELPQE